MGWLLQVGPWVVSALTGERQVVRAGQCAGEDCGSKGGSSASRRLRSALPSSSLVLIIDAKNTSLLIVL